ncbi:UNVERIFIED_CONTAM: bZIP transcription factor 16 [Sesamum calycinum]|uniref:BZIP transcription factor 16 n=1 Tax=Sesamum calycinum TaxID=2727403 RepID=A0AAW2QVI8_9LAMI
MGNSEVDKSSKEGKEAKEPKTPPPQEQTSAASGAAAADWTGFQAYSPMPPHGFLASSAQAHPTCGEFSNLFHPMGPLRILMLPCTPWRDICTSNFGSGMFSDYPFSPLLCLLQMVLLKPLAESASEGSCEGSDTNSQNNVEKQIVPTETLSLLANSIEESPRKSGSQQDSDEPSQNGHAAHSSQNGGSATPHSVVNHTMAIMPITAAGVVGGFPGPTTNLNIGMDYWAATPTSAVPAMHGKVPSTPVQGGIVPTGSRDGVQSQIWIQDERELKRQRRKQSNRESARRSRLRKQAECDELARCAETLKEENASLRAELAHIRGEYEHLLAQNASLKERLDELPQQEDPRCSQDDQHSGDDAQHLGQADHTE